MVIHNVAHPYLLPALIAIVCGSYILYNLICFLALRARRVKLEEARDLIEEGHDFFEIARNPAALENGKLLDGNLVGDEIAKNQKKIKESRNKRRNVGFFGKRKAKKAEAAKQALEAKAAEDAAQNEEEDLAMLADEVYLLMDEADIYDAQHPEIEDTLQWFAKKKESDKAAEKYKIGSFLKPSSKAKEKKAKKIKRSKKSDQTSADIEVPESFLEKEQPA